MIILVSMRVFMVSAQKSQKSAGHVLISYLSSTGGNLEVPLPRPVLNSIFKEHFYTDKGFDKTKFVRVARRIAADNQIIFKEKKKLLKLSLTPEGDIQALKYQVEELNLVKPSWWDRKWRIVIFDIPEEKRSARTFFQEKLVQMGFIRLQNSIYAHAYPCHNEIELIRSVYGIKPYVRMLIAEKIENEASLRESFDLV